MIVWPVRAQSVALVAGRHDAGRQVLDHGGRRLDDERRSEHGQDGGVHEQLVDLAADQARTRALLGQEEGELTDLGKAEPGQQRAAQGIAERQRGQEDQAGLGGDEDHGHEQDQLPVRRQVAGLEQHADGDEEDAGEIIPEGNDVRSRCRGCTPIPR